VLLLLLLAAGEANEKGWCQASSTPCRHKPPHLPPCKLKATPPPPLPARTCAPGPGPQEADVVGHLHEADRDRVERAAHLDHAVVRGQRLKLVGGGDEGQPGVVPHLARDGDVKALLGVEAGAHRGAALRQAQQRGEGALHTLDAVRHLGAAGPMGVWSWQLLYGTSALAAVGAQRIAPLSATTQPTLQATARAPGRTCCVYPENSCPSVSGVASWVWVRPILMMSANSLDLEEREAWARVGWAGGRVRGSGGRVVWSKGAVSCRPPSTRLKHQRTLPPPSTQEAAHVQLLEGRQQRVDHLCGAGDVHHAWEGVVGGLALVHVVVGVDLGVRGMCVCVGRRGGCMRGYRGWVETGGI